MTPLAVLVVSKPGFELVGEFFAQWQGRRVKVTAVLERTAVVQDGPNVEDKRLVRHDSLLADPDRLPWIAVSGYNVKAAMTRSRNRGHALSLGRGRNVANPLVSALALELAQLREDGKHRCPNPACHHVGPLAEFNSNGYCKPCAQAHNRRYREKQAS